MRLYYQLYIGEEKRGTPDAIDVSEAAEIIDLRKIVKNDRQQALSHCDAADLSVYYPDTERPFSAKTFIRGDVLIKELENKNPRVTIDYDYPLIVVALAPKQTDDDDVLRRIEKKIDDMATISVGMSEANMDFTSELLSGRGIKFRTLPVCEEIEDKMFVQRTYQWGENEHEKDGQEGCKEILKKELSPLFVNGRELGIFDVRGKGLPEVQGGRRKTNGFSDLAIGDLATLSRQQDEDLMFALSPGLVELKSGKYPLKQGQLLLQLESLSLISNAKKGVVVLGTDCATKWRLVYFTNFNEITTRSYLCGKKCLDDLKLKLERSEENERTLVAPAQLPSIEEDEGHHLEDADNQDTMNKLVSLNQFRNHLASLFPDERESLKPVMDKGCSKPPSMIYI